MGHIKKYRQLIALSLSNLKPCKLRAGRDSAQRQSGLERGLLGRVRRGGADEPRRGEARRRSKIGSKIEMD